MFDALFNDRDFETINQIGTARNISISLIKGLRTRTQLTRSLLDSRHLVLPVPRFVIEGANSDNGLDTDQRMIQYWIRHRILLYELFQKGDSITSHITAENAFIQGCTVINPSYFDATVTTDGGELMLSLKDSNKLQSQFVIMGDTGSQVHCIAMAELTGMLRLQGQYQSYLNRIVQDDTFVSILPNSAHTNQAYFELFRRDLLLASKLAIEIATKCDVHRPAVQFLNDMWISRLSSVVSSVRILTRSHGNEHLLPELVASLDLFLSLFQKWDASHPLFSCLYAHDQYVIIDKLSCYLKKYLSHRIFFSLSIPIPLESPEKVIYAKRHQYKEATEGNIYTSRMYENGYSPSDSDTRRQSQVIESFNRWCRAIDAGRRSRGETPFSVDGYCNHCHHQNINNYSDRCQSCSLLEA